MYLCLIIIVGGIDVDSGTAECAAVFLFGFVFNSCEVPCTEESLCKLHTYFGPVSQSLFADVYSAVSYIRSCLSDASIEKISAALDAAKNGNQSVNEEFGRNIKAAFNYGSTANDEDLDWLESDDDDDISASGFSMNYIDVSQRGALQTEVRDVVAEETNFKHQKTDSRAWLYEEVVKYFSTESSDPETCIDDLVSTVFDILCSSKSNDQLQTEVSHSFPAKYFLDVCIEYRPRCCELKINSKTYRMYSLPSMRHISRNYFGPIHFR